VEREVEVVIKDLLQFSFKTFENLIKRALKFSPRKA
jgi:hypothetical protein